MMYKIINPLPPNNKPDQLANACPITVQYNSINKWTN